MGQHVEKLTGNRGHAPPQAAVAAHRDKLVVAARQHQHQIVVGTQGGPQPDGLRFLSTHHIHIAKAIQRHRLGGVFQPRNKRNRKRKEVGKFACDQPGMKLCRAGRRRQMRNLHKADTLVIMPYGRAEWRTSCAVMPAESITCRTHVLIPLHKRPLFPSIAVWLTPASSLA